MHPLLSSRDTFSPLGHAVNVRHTISVPNGNEERTDWSRPTGSNPYSVQRDITGPRIDHSFALTHGVHHTQNEDLLRGRNKGGNPRDLQNNDPKKVWSDDLTAYLSLRTQNAFKQIKDEIPVVLNKGFSNIALEDNRIWVGESVTTKPDRPETNTRTDPLLIYPEENLSHRRVAAAGNGHVPQQDTAGSPAYDLFNTQNKELNNVNPNAAARELQSGPVLSSVPISNLESRFPNVY